jgi:hypothetical protein
VRLLLVEPQPHERVRRRRRRRERLDRPRSLADHRDELLAGVGARPRDAQELRCPRAGGDPERDQRPVPVRPEPGEQLVEHAVGDLPGNRLRDSRPEQAGLPPRERLQRVVMRVRPPRPGQRERVHDRPGPGLQAIRVEAPAYRFAVRHRRRREPYRRRPRPGYRPNHGRPPPGLFRELEPAAEVPGLHPRRLAPRHLDGPGEPEPAQQCQ